MAEFVMKDLTSQYEIEKSCYSNWEHRNPILKGLQRFLQSWRAYDASKTSFKSVMEFSCLWSDLEWMRYVWLRLETEHKIHLFAGESVQIHGAQRFQREETYRVFPSCELLKSGWID